MREQVKNIIKTMSLEDKARFASGKDFWHLEDDLNNGLKSIMLTDGPHGLRKQSGDGDHLGIMYSVPTTCFPTAAGLASTWNTSLIHQVGEVLATECLSEQVSVLLGPGANIKRHPLCGRNFEYFSEDPLLSGKLSAAWINGLQSKGIGASLKHYVANNQEYNRMVSDSIVDERTLRELYLKSFEIAVKESQPWTIMCSYNKVNGTYVSEHDRLLNIILKEEWKHEGLVVTDWGACNDRVSGLIAGQELEMPPSGTFRTKQIIDAVRSGELDESLLNRRIERVIDLILKGNDNLQENPQPFDRDAHHSFARKVAAESVVLLKNENNILPLQETQSVALIGEFAEKPRYQGAGSSMINPTKLSTAKESISRLLGDRLVYAKGYDSTSDTVDNSLVEEALAVIEHADVVVVMAGLTNTYESEGFDRTHLDLPKNHNDLISRISEIHDNVIVALSNGAPVAMPWKNNVQAIVEQYLGGQASGDALTDILFGHVNPSGKLAETFPNTLYEFPSNQSFPGDPRQVQYREGLYVGYRAYSSMNIEPLYPFGYGLSYTTFKYSNLNVTLNDEEIHVTCDITNTGNMDGQEVVQVYVHKPSSNVYRPYHELKGFDKILIKSQETKKTIIKIPISSLSIYNDSGFKVEQGEYNISIGSSSTDIFDSVSIFVESSDIVVPDELGGYKHISNQFTPTLEMFEKLYGKPIPIINPITPFHINSTIGEMSVTWIGKQLKKMIKKQLTSIVGDAPDEAFAVMAEAIVSEMPLRSLIVFSNGELSEKRALGFIDLANNKFFRGLWKIITG
jgi:beta-glucosidase